MRNRRAPASAKISRLYGLYTWSIESEKFSIRHRVGLATKAGVRASVRRVAARMNLRVEAWKWED